ncbi:acyl-CoA N-acyltransferase [Piromyces finnis]|uniref:Acyl-CoA N-acyltransferase n=1 Tax=Piromyces finnis TaxID=1754191 RepID=A0A1Y1VFC5_9FUNG|nr:acyl-CoA N-acyltransferase [Piromyces finnis]|eukprot:ORX54816.1 acyl-CoA N-acyltransferase [Piromyces finnis]
MSVSLGDLTPNNIKQLKVLNSVIFPEKKFEESYYKDCLEKLEWSQLGFFNDVNVGGISYIEEEIPENKDQLRVNIKTLGVLPAYRRLGVASELLKYVFDNCKENEKIKEIYVQIQQSNESAINLFKKNNFEVKEKDQDAIILIKNL